MLISLKDITELAFTVLKVLKMVRLSYLVNS